MSLAVPCQMPISFYDICNTLLTLSLIASKNSDKENQVNICSSPRNVRMCNFWEKKTAGGKKIRGSFQKFCTPNFFSIKINLFYKIHLQAFNVISIVLYHSGPTFGQVFYSCLDAFVVDASDYSGHLIRHLLNASEAFPMEWFLQFWEQVKVWWAQPTRL
jgi:hypothetical protein